jgi:hypothetical protein
MTAFDLQISDKAERDDVLVQIGVFDLAQTIENQLFS